MTIMKLNELKRLNSDVYCSSITTTVRCHIQVKDMFDLST